MRRLDDMAVFERIIREGSLSGAARALHMPKSTVSDRLARLETRLGIQLIQRTTRRLHPTDAGLDYYERCRQIVELADTAEAELDQGRDPLHGPVQIIAHPDAASFVQASVRKAIRAWPQLQIAIQLHTGSLPSGLPGSGFDLGLSFGEPEHESELEAPRPRSRQLLRSPMRCVASPAYIAAHGRPHLPAALCEHRCVGRCAEERWIFFAPDEVLTLRPALAVDSHTHVLAAALAGLGVARLPSFVCGPSVATGELVSLFDGQVADGPPLLLHLPARPPARVRAFVELLESANDDPEMG